MLRLLEPRCGGEVEVAGGDDADRLARTDADGGADLAVLLQGRRCRVLPSAEDDRSAAAGDGGEATDHRQQHRRAEALEEVRVDFAGYAAAAVERGAGRGERDGDAIGADQPGPDHISALLPGLEAALVLADQPRAARHEQPRAVEAAHVLADDGADIAGTVGI